VSALETTGKGR